MNQDPLSLYVETLMLPMSLNLNLLEGSYPSTMANKLRCIQNESKSQRTGILPEMHWKSRVRVQSRTLDFQTVTDCFGFGLWRSIVTVRSHVSDPPSGRRAPNIQLMTNWRGICLMSLAAKLYNSMVLIGNLTPIDAILRKNQVGFITGRSCIQQIYN